MNKRVLITGGAGFIGINAAGYFIDQGNKVLIIDDLSRKGTDKNLKWIQNSRRVHFNQVDIRDYPKLKMALMSFQPDLVLHLAAQVAVTTSVTNPRQDFEINALGTFNLLEAVRESGLKPAFIYASTNKVYGRMEELRVSENESRYELPDLSQGVSESRPLDFHSPYGCSKGAADQYVRDYWRIYGLPTVVFRQSCIYGQHQFGIEDQGWVAWFTIATILKKPLTIFGNGKQVRDVLFVDDLIRAFDLAWQKIEKSQGQVYNLGGGPSNSISLLEFLALLEKISKCSIEPSFSDWRPGDQPVYISDIRKVQQDLNWRPQVSIEKGLKSLVTWVEKNKLLLQEVLS